MFLIDVLDGLGSLFRSKLSVDYFYITFMFFIMMSLYFVIIHGNDLVLWLFKGINYDNFHFKHVVC